jgi:hypothetical protein
MPGPPGCLTTTALLRAWFDRIAARPSWQAARPSR